MVVARVDKLDVADEMLDAAITEFFESRHFAALNAAAVAQELYGKQARIDGLEDQIQETIKVANKLASQRGGAVSDKDWKRIAVHAKNSIKHFDSGNDRHIEIDAQDEARLMIHDAISERDKLMRGLSPHVERFSEYAREYVRRAVG